MVTIGNMMAQVVKNKVKKSDPVSKAMYKQFKMVGAFVRRKRIQVCMVFIKHKLL